MGGSRSRIKAGASVVWRSLKRARASTKSEHFYGIVVGKPGDMIVLLQSDAIDLPQKVLRQYIVPACGEWLLAPGGRCYAKEEVLRTLRDKAVCPACNRAFNTQFSYESHYLSVHQ